MHVFTLNSCLAYKDIMSLVSQVLLPVGDRHAKFGQRLEAKSDERLPEVSGDLRLEVDQSPHNQEHNKVERVADVSKPEMINMEGRGRQKENRFDLHTLEGVYLQVFHGIKILSVCEEMVVDAVGPSVSRHTLHIAQGYWCVRARSYIGLAQTQRGG